MKIRTNNYKPYNDLSPKHINLYKNAYEDTFVDKHTKVNGMESKILNANFDKDRNVNVIKINIDKSVKLQDIEIGNGKESENVKFIFEKNVKSEDVEIFNPEPSLTLSETIYHGQMRQYDEKIYMSKKNRYKDVAKKRVKREDDECEGFRWEKGSTVLRSPVNKNSSNTRDANYASNVDCYTVIRGN